MSVLCAVYQEVIVYQTSVTANSMEAIAVMALLPSPSNAALHVKPFISSMLDEVLQRVTGFKFFPNESCIFYQSPQERRIAVLFKSSGGISVERTAVASNSPHRRLCRFEGLHMLH